MPKTTALPLWSRGPSSRISRCRRPRLGSELQATAAAAPATAPVASGLPPSLAQAHPEDQKELANLLDKVIDRNTGCSGGTGSGPPDLPSAVAAAIRADGVVEDAPDGGGGGTTTQIRASRALLPARRVRSPLLGP